MIKVIIIDDHPIVSDGLKNLLTNRDDMEVMACYDTGQAGLEGISSLRPSVVLLDINLPDISGVEICKQIRKTDTQVGIIALSMHNERAVIKSILQSGANGYVLKNSVGQEIISAIQAILSGQKYLCAKSKDIMYSHQKGDLVEIPHITRREKEILELVGKGLTTGQIATQLFISPHTVESHRKNLIEKFEVTGMSAVVNLATKYGLI
ncbi:DNA-binding NarL/FixJ family response regulator [Pedobacter africanus]|uniref:DNA-binding NarL/FixJ family response regulator n=1 Tax=Pedobacter africanus TaxID=151894 RepID=A0ACC6L174_9SPHI|nr:response regulator transcription factor [Pedobacter africanus]MDR6785175.1 DNA-binding NarL/FixJ family response regulator [Pedobacter africanus]